MPRAEAQRHTVREMLEKYRDEILIPLKPKEIRSQGPQLDWWISQIGAYSLPFSFAAEIPSTLPARSSAKSWSSVSKNVELGW